MVFSPKSQVLWVRGLGLLWRLGFRVSHESGVRIQGVGLVWVE